MKRLFQIYRLVLIHSFSFEKKLKLNKVLIVHIKAMQIKHKVW